MQYLVIRNLTHKFCLAYKINHSLRKEAWTKSKSFLQPNPLLSRTPQQLLKKNHFSLEWLELPPQKKFIKNPIQPIEEWDGRLNSLDNIYGKSAKSTLNESMSPPNW